MSIFIKSLGKASEEDLKRMVELSDETVSSIKELLLAKVERDLWRELT